MEFTQFVLLFVFSAGLFVAGLVIGASLMMWTFKQDPDKWIDMLKKYKEKQTA